MLLFECDTDIKQFEIEVPQGTRVFELIEKIHKENYNENIKGMLLNAQNRLKVAVLINQSSASLDTILNDKDEIVFCSVVSGG